MDGWPVGRLLTAAEISGTFVKLRVAIMVRGDQPLLYMQVVPVPDVEFDEKSYARWSTRVRGPVPEDWAPRAGNPWRVCRYSGPLTTLTTGDFDQLIDSVSGGGKEVIAGLLGIIDAHLDGASLALKDRRILLQFLKRDFSAPIVEILVRPEDSDDSCDLSLLSAQQIHRAVAAREPLTPTQVRQAKILLKYAPWNLGYWGPFKALVKSVPVKDLADAYADAIARLSSTENTVSVPAKIVIENRDELSGWFGIPTKRTQQYLARRVRRDLADLSRQSPDAYARVASRMLTSWDEPLSNYSYAPAFVMLGARGPLDGHGRYVRRAADMSLRRDAHPEIWDVRPGLVAKVFGSVRSSVETLTWATQVLDGVGSVPKIPARSIALALDSTYPVLRRIGCEALPGSPGVLESLTGSQWTVFFQYATDGEIAQVAEGLAAKKLTIALGEAVAAVFTRTGLEPRLRAQLALMYLAAPKAPFVNHSDADVTAVTAAIEGSGLENQTLWEPVVARMGPWAIAEIYRSLAARGVDGAGPESIASALLGKNNHPADLILEFLGSDNAGIEELGWRLVEAHGGQTFLFTQLLPSAGPSDRISPEAAWRVVERMMERASEPRDVAQLVRWSLSVGVDHSALASIITGNPLGPPAMWEMLGAEDHSGPLALVETADLTQQIGNIVTAGQLEAAKPAQLTLIRRYITDNRRRMSEDANFGVAAFKSADARLQAAALKQLKSAGQLAGTWLAIAGTGHAPGIQAARRYLESMKDPARIREAILACLASEDSGLQTMGLELFRSRDALADDPAILAALATSNDQVAQDIVADAATSGTVVDEQIMQGFDRRILTDKKSSPRVKESVKRRLETSEAAAGAETHERVALLLELARGNLKGDREWALTRLAALALHGVRVEGLEVSLTTEGVVGLEDVAP